MKRLGLILLCSAVLAGALAATPASAAGKVLTVFAASSLADFAKEAKQAFEKAHPGVEVRINLASSSELRIQIDQGAPADVFLAADTENMDPLVAARAVEKPVVFCHNTLAIVVAKRSRNRVQCAADLGASGTRLALAAPNTPIGRYTRQVIAKLDKGGKCGRSFGKKVLANVRSEEPTVKAVLVKTVLGEADAGLVYSTDITQGLQRTVRVITIPVEYNVVASYPIAVVSRSKNKDLAREFQKFVLSPQGKQMLRKHGFLA